MFTVSKPTVQLLAETYYLNASQKVLNCRPDILAQLLYYSEVGFNSNVIHCHKPISMTPLPQVLCVESCEGLVAAALFDRLVCFNAPDASYNGGFLCHLDVANKNDTCTIFKQLQFELFSMGTNYQKYPWSKVLSPTSETHSLIASS